MMRKLLLQLVTGPTTKCLDYKYTRNLRSQSQHLLSVPKSRTVTYGDRAFSVCAPKLWNELPFQLRID